MLGCIQVAPVDLLTYVGTHTCTPKRGKTVVLDGVGILLYEHEW